MGIFRERASAYLGLRAPRQETKPLVRPFLVAGIVWGAVMGVLMQWLSGRGFSVWVFVFWVLAGILGFGLCTYWLASRKWRSKEH